MKKQNPDRLQWCAVDAEGPMWLRSAAWDGEQVFMPFPNDRITLMCAAYDGVPVVSSDSHYYFPTHWIAREYGEYKEVAAKIEAKVRAHFQGQ